MCSKGSWLEASDASTEDSDKSAVTAAVHDAQTFAGKLREQAKTQQLVGDSVQERTVLPGFEQQAGQLQSASVSGDTDVRGSLGQQFTFWLAQPPRKQRSARR